MLEEQVLPRILQPAPEYDAVPVGLFLAPQE